MGKYAYKAMEEMAAELAAGLARLRKGYVDSAESLAMILDDDQEYPYDFVVFRLTGYRPRSIDKSTPRPMLGSRLRRDLLEMMIKICDSFDLRTGEYEEPAVDTQAVANRYNVSTKTVQRWRLRGLPTRRMIFPDGRKRIAFLESSLQRFISRQEGEVSRSVRFTQLSEQERRDIFRRAKRMALFTHCSLSDVAKRLAARSGRAMETIRYTLRNHDIEHPEDPIFPYLFAPLNDQEKIAIYRGYLRGLAVPALAQRHHRTRGTIYRVVNEVRAQQLLKRSVNYVYSSQFDLPNADEIIMAAVPLDGDSSKPAPRPPSDLPPYLRALYDVPLLTSEGEKDLFRRYNYLKYKADKQRKGIDLNRVRTRKLREIEDLLLQSNVVKNQIIRANLRLVVSIAKKHVGKAQTLFELISDGNVSLMRAVEKFDYTRGNRFSTYASWAIIRNFARSVPKELYQLDRFATGNEEVLDIAASLRTYDPNELNLRELRESIDAVLTRLNPQERAILIDHYGLDPSGKSKTLEELGRQLGISKERVRQIELQAMKKLRGLMQPEQSDLMA
ncbi:MAG: sigma-70 family RNA polymerase sigma factor [Planctomycetaceae bacterium]|nr:sigma-70 family RNA polymerase sigma factor [Planctomycetaceae bacterium]